MRLPLKQATFAALACVCACATSSGEEPPDPDAAPPIVDPDASSVVVSSCVPGEFATGFEADGTLACAPIDAAALSTFAGRCSLYAGWRDSCDGCTSAPTKWGRVSGDDCANGAGAANTCTTASLGGVIVSLFGLNPDGDVNDDDKLYIGLQCAASDDVPSAGPCAEGEFLSGLAGGGECVSGQGAIATYLDEGCDVYFGWRDNCDGCTSAPAKWGVTSGAGCAVGAGANGSCQVPLLGDDLVQTFGLNTDGDVDGNDKLYLGLQCSGAEASISLQSESCPAGELVVGIDAAGDVECASPLPDAEVAVQDGCYLYFGWRDSCDGCTAAPAKWGRVGHGLCENGVGADNTCATTPLDGLSLPLFGLNTDGDVGGDDKLYFGLACP